MYRWQGVLRPRTAVLVASGFVLACADGPTEAPREDTPRLSGHHFVAAIACAADVAAGRLTCARGSPSGGEGGPQLLIVGGQDLFVTLTGSNVGYNANNQRWRADVTLTNLIRQALGTTDGINPDNINVFLHEGPTVTTGTGTVAVANADGVGTFTGASQPFFSYPGLLDQGATSEKRVWQFSASPGITFGFSVLVSATVQYPDGWVEVTPATATVAVGATETLTAVVYDVVGRGTGGTVTWMSSAPTIASVDMVTGVVTGVSAGTAIITASTGGPEADGTAEITVPL